MNTYELQRPAQIARPMSWHPSPNSLQRPSISSQYLHNNPRYSTMTDQQSLATEELTTPVMPPNMENSFVPAYIGLDGSYGTYQSSLMDVYSEHPEGFNLDTTYDSCLEFSAHAKPHITSYDEYQPPPPPPCATQTWTDSLASFPSYPNPPTPDFLPIQHPTDAWTESSEEVVMTKPVRKQSMELVGMGLYDSPTTGASDSGMDGLLPYEAGEGMQGASLGKGLKLEETWQPPEEDDTSSVNGPTNSEPRSTSPAQEAPMSTAVPDNPPLHTSSENYSQDYDIQAWPLNPQEQAYPFALKDYAPTFAVPDYGTTAVNTYGWN